MERERSPAGLSKKLCFPIGAVIIFFLQAKMAYAFFIIIPSTETVSFDILYNNNNNNNYDGKA